MKIAFIGGGNMGEAIIAALLKKGLAEPGSTTVSDVTEARLDFLHTQYGVSVTSDNRRAVSGADIVVLAIKPQTLPQAAPDLARALKPDQLVLSIIAGATIQKLSSSLSHQMIVRSMPNTPAQVGEGMTVWTATPQVTDSQKAQARSILAAMGKEIYVDDEKYLDMATAVSGSGPAYFFLFVESLVEAAVRVGIPREQAAQLVLQTMTGSAKLLEKSGKAPEELRRMVTSPGGTTAKAIEKFEQGRVRELVLEAVQAAYARAQELGRQ